MANKCTICRHKDRKRIDRAVIAGGVIRRIAKDFDVSEPSLRRHVKGCIADKVQKTQKAIEKNLEEAVAEEAAEETRIALDVVSDLKAINLACKEVLEKAREQGHDETLLRAVDRIHKQIELQARLLGELEDSKTINIITSPVWIEIRSTIIHALGPYPEARIAVAQALKEVNA